MKKTERIVITGGSGFIGSFLVDRLIRDGFSNVVVLERTPAPHTSVTHHTCNVFRDTDLLNTYIHEGDTVVHLACTTMPSTSELNRVKDAEENISGTLRLLDICKEKKIKKFIFASSGGTVYGNSSQRHYSEEDSTHPENSYGAIKLTIENYLGVYNHLYNLKYVTLRIANPYGRKKLVSTQLGAVDIFLRHAMENQKITIWGDGETIRDYIHIDDVVDFLITSIEKEEVEGIYNVGTGIGTSLNRIIEEIQKVLRRPVNPEYKTERKVDVKRNVLNIQKAKKTGWVPKYTLSKGIHTLYKEILKN